MKLKEFLKGKIPEPELVPSSFDVVGDIAIFVEFPKELKKYEKKIGLALMQLNKNIHVVCKKVKKYSGKYRTAKLQIIAGEKRKETTHIENGCRFMLDVEKVYFSTRSGNERQRISNLVKKNEDVLVMFSGCGPFTVQIAKKAKSAVGIEMNPAGHMYEMMNIKLNKIHNATALKGDVRKVKLKQKFDRIVMPLPKDATDYLKEALKFSKKGAMIHLYTFARDEEIEAREKIVEEICKKYKRTCRIISVVKAGEYAPHVHRLCLDIKVD